MRRAITTCGTALLAIGLAVPAYADGVEPNECAPDEVTLEKLAHAKALSLDLRGRLPTMNEYATVASASEIPESMVDEWLASDDFAERIVRHHRDLLWNNISGINLHNYAVRFQGGIMWRRDASVHYRGGEYGCLNEPARFADDGEILYTETVRTRIENGREIREAVRQEGYVEVAPYWAPDTTVRVCAYDAQDRLHSSSGTSCGTTSGVADVECGCGPNLRWCVAGAVGNKINRAMMEDVERRIRGLVMTNRPYTDLFSSRVAYVNGPLSHYYRYQTGFPGDVAVLPNPVDAERVPEIPFHEEDTWVAYELPEHHAGILTSPAFLLRFQTQRARANRFFDAFLCSPLQPPKGGLVFDGVPHRDLQRRQGCKYCHALLEPTGAFWGRWPENGAGFLPAEKFPAVRDDCMACARRGQRCNTECRRYYMMSAFNLEEEQFLGMLNSYYYRRDQHFTNVEEGPKLLVLSAVVDSRFPTCAATKLATRMLGRDLAEGDQDWLDRLARDFVASGYDYRALVKSVVMSDVYRRVQ